MAIRKSRKVHPTFLRVTPEVEARWKKGEFDDAAAKQRMTESLKLLQDVEVKLPCMHEIFVEQFQAGTLSGARLGVLNPWSCLSRR